MEEERRLMYVGITRAKKNLFLSCAKRRKMWGDYKYYNPSRFISEIPAELIETEESDNVSLSGRETYTFKKAVDSIKSRTISENADGSIKAVTSFGKNFVAPKKRIQHNTSFVIKSKHHDEIKAERQKSDEQKIKDLLENNPIQKMIMERKQKESENSDNNTNNTYTPLNTEYNPGDRVFHSKFGIGKVIEIKDVGSSTMIIAEFGKFGQKALDSAFAQLKKF
jgi:DNA helicase-2/ATP-dependent DNA helicase PcrA